MQQVILAYKIDLPLEVPIYNLSPRVLTNLIVSNLLRLILDSIYSSIIVSELKKVPKVTWKENYQGFELTSRRRNTPYLVMFAANGSHPWPSAGAAISGRKA